jgi:hypothetical protein
MTLLEFMFKDGWHFVGSIILLMILLGRSLITISSTKKDKDV